MKRIVSEWVAKAEGDFATMRREIRARKDPNPDSACFHAQQCAEKYLKALLLRAGIPFSRTHDLVNLLEPLLPDTPALTGSRVDLAYLSQFAVAFRYPGESATREAALDAGRRCQRFRQAIREELGLVDD
ncbi:MAG: hypothetical protein BIFFINMI_03940 [Phycisphaerae bacterium]|nr:hypothetical protein [Phycisphaerae bacterium]